MLANIIKARKEAALSQKELASLVGLTQPDISKIERFERRLDVVEFIDMLTQISKRLNRDLSYIWQELYEHQCKQ
ncbi:helix-turn-helix transcriptional regulator [Pseudoalteromonas xiamenensis]|uniref:Helix-turn-helix transcriptional regulator n=1 Tax=Pseudoalteromonas xiamenensis TaxID=882626 RepID=A0A975DF42_9GAMM|nr:helix-turn-helix transcriptional regulator [Pseudoalteromonas xiamenensis]